MTQTESKQAARAELREACDRSGVRFYVEGGKVELDPPGFRPMYIFPDFPATAAGFREAVKAVEYFETGEGGCFGDR